jgi:electron transfer flavoprotein alpha/beta subunit
MEELSLDSLKDERVPQAAVKVAAVTVQSVKRKKVLYEGPPQETAQKLLEALRKEGVI